MAGPKIRRHLVSTGLSAGFLASCLAPVLFVAPASAYVKGKTYRLTVLHTNDHHGVFWKNERGEYGMAARATLIEAQRAEIKAAGGHVLLLDGGDVNTGTPESEMADAEPDFRGMSLMRYDAMAVGNHEFDKPFETLMKQRKAWANFPFLSANIYEKKNGKRVFDAHKTLVVDGLRVALLGLTTEQTPQQSIRFPHARLEVRNPIVEAAKLVPGLRKKNDLVIAITHMGHYPNEQHGSRAPGDVTLARKVSGIDLIVGGHTQLPLFKADFMNGTHIVQAGEWGKHLGRVDLEFIDGKVKLVDYRLIPVNLRDAKGKLEGTEIVEDAKTLAMLEPFKTEAEKTTAIVVGQLEGRFEGHRSVIRKQETNLGNFVTSLMAADTGSDVGIINSGVIRNSIEPGPVTFGEILTVHPPAFALEHATVEMSGNELRAYLEKVTALTDGAYPQMHGLKVVRTPKGISSIEVRDRAGAAFAPIVDTKTYKLALADFIGQGGDGYPKVSDRKTYRLSGIVDSASMRRHFEQKKTVRADDYAPISNLVVKAE